jgi:hypothetical protein
MDKPSLKLTSKDIIDTLWRKGVLHWKLKPIQKVMHEKERTSTALIWVENCSRRLGKSYRLAIKALEVGLTQREAVIPFAAPTLKMIRDITLPIFREICRDAPSDIKPIWRQSEGKFLFPSTKSEIVLAGVNSGNAEKLRGRKATIAIVDEAGFIENLDYLVQDVLMPQLLTTNGKILMASSPSRTPAHAFRDYCMRAQRENVYSEYDIYQAGYTPEKIEKFKKEAGGENSTTWKREYLCQFVVDADYHIIPEWRDAFAVEIKRHEYFKYYYRYVFMDMGVKDKTVILFAYYDFLNARLVIEGEIVMQGPEMTTEKIAAKIKEKEATLWPDLRVHRRIADNNNPLMLLDLGSLHDIHFSPTQKTGKTERTTIIEAMVNELRINVGSGKVIVSPNCPETIGCLKFGIWNKNRTQFERVKEYGHFDALAALIYGNRAIDRVTNPIPMNLGISTHTHLIMPEPKINGPLAENIKKMFNLKR